LIMMISMVNGAGCRAPFMRHADRKYQAPARNEAGSGEVLYQRLGGEKGVGRIVDGWVARAGVDAKVNFTRAGTGRGWQATSENMARLKKHLVQYVSGASGGPTKFEGRDLLRVHEGMGIREEEFEAFVADLEKTMEELGVGAREREDLIRVLEPVRSLIVEKGIGAH